MSLSQSVLCSLCCLLFKAIWLRSSLCALCVLLWQSALAEVHYVDVNSTNATPPYASWTTAATNIQDAVDAAVAGDEIVVTNGIYTTGGTNGNRVMVDKPLSLRSVNGAQFTTIDGGQSNRCVYFTNNSSISGFTLTNGTARYGAGAYGGTLNNCTLTGNRASAFLAVVETYAQGGGAYGSTLNNCTLTGNWASAGSGVVETYAQGGGAYGSTLNNCTLTGNRALTQIGGYASGGGAYGGTLNNCTLTGNRASGDSFSFGVAAQGGGAYDGTLNNCTLTGNRASASGVLTDAQGGGAYGGTLNNCIVYFNTAQQGTNYYYSTMNYSWSDDPLFVDQASGNLRLQSNSPCINAGLNEFAPAGPDLDGNPRIVGGTVDIGAYEYQSLDLLNFGVVSNQFGFNVTGQSNWVIVLEASSDFTNWTPLTTNTLSGSPFPFRDPAPPILPQRFYRARQW